MRNSVVKIFFSTDKEKNRNMRDEVRDQILTGYLSEEIHRKLRRLNLRKEAQVQ